MALDPILERAVSEARSGRMAESLVTVRRLVQRQPANLDALQVLALLLMQSGQAEQAAHFLERAVELAPATASIRNNFATVLLQLNRPVEAVAQLRKAIEIKPEYELAYVGLSCALLQVPDSEGAIAAARRGLELAPQSPDMINNLALAFGQAGRTEESLAEAERGHRAHPHNAKLHSLYLMNLIGTDRPAREIFEAHRRFGELHPSQAGPARTDLDPDRRLRVAWLSSDLRTHSVGFFAEPLFEHAPAWVDTHLLSLNPGPLDATTQRLKQHAKDVDQVGSLDDAALDRHIRQLGIDILIDAQGHTPGNRLPALGAKPAPLMVTAIAYPDTTGVPAMDYRVVDSITDPPGAESLATETLLRLNPCFLCYRPPADAPEPALSTAGSPITFGSFNAPSKVGDRTVALWWSVLDAVPASRLLLKAKDLSEETSRATMLDRLARGGIDAGRVEILSGTATVAAHLGLYSRMHIALDTVPYNGTTTTCEALWMGVPVVTLEGYRHVSRVGCSMLHAVGRPEWIARSPDQYREIAAALAGDAKQLSSLRRELRPAMSASPLCDARAYADRFYGALRKKWRDYCGRAVGGGPRD